jgi:hypothetical protein
MFENVDRERGSLGSHESAPDLFPAEMSDRELETVTAGKYNPGGLGGPYSGLGVRPGAGVGAPGFGWRRGRG